MVGDYHFMSAFESALYAENQTGSCESCFPCKSEGKSIKCIQSPKKLYTFNIGTLTLIPYCPKIWMSILEPVDVPKNGYLISWHSLASGIGLHCFLGPVFPQYIRVNMVYVLKKKSAAWLRFIWSTNFNFVCPIFLNLIGCMPCINILILPTLTSTICFINLDKWYVQRIVADVESLQ